MICTFTCSGNSCQKKSETFTGCLLKCDPSLYRACIEAGIHKFENYSPNDAYFEEFEMLDAQTKNAIREMLKIANRISANPEMHRKNADSDYANRQNTVRTMLKKQLSGNNQKLNKWINRILHAGVRDVKSALNLSSGVLSVPN
jgi:hypothetical protein